MKQEGEKITMVTSYDYTLASLADAAGVDTLLVGDSASNIVCGNQTTLPISMDEMIFLTKGVVRAAQHALVITDSPLAAIRLAQKRLYGMPSASSRRAVQML
jgi:3-methyl-2-oxobutanoate hydroxymethyltransferase